MGLVRRPASPRSVWKRFNALHALSIDMSTTEAERASAEARLKEYLTKYRTEAMLWRKQQDASQRTRLLREETVAIGSGLSRWRRGDELRPGLWRGIVPDGVQVMVTICTVRKEHVCRGCRQTIPKGGRAWRAVAYNGDYRMQRHCVACWAPDPNVVLQLTTDARHPVLPE